MADQAIDYSALADQARQGTTPPSGNAPAAQGPIDYSALANQARGGAAAAYWNLTPASDADLEPIEYRNGLPVYSIDVYGRAGPPPEPPVFQGTDEQGKPIIAPPPGPPPSPIPYGLETLQQQAASSPVRLNPRTGLPMTPMPMGTIPLIDLPYTEGGEAIGGIERIAGAPTSQGFEPWLRQAAGGASQTVRGTLGALTPFIPGAAIEAPLATLITLGTGRVLSAGSEATLNALGVPKEYSALASDLIGIFGAGAAYSKMRALAKLPYVAESNAIQTRLEEAARTANDPAATEMERAAARARVDALMDGLQRAEAGQPGGYLYPQVSPGQLLPGPRVSPEKSAAAQDVIGLGQKYGVRLTAGDISQSPALKNVEIAGEKVPLLGLQKLREAQQQEVRAAAGGVKSQYEEALIDADPSSLSELQDAAEGGDQRARNVLEKMNSAGNDPDRIIQASIGLGDWTTRQTATELYDHVQKLAEDHNLGDVPLDATGKAIGSSLQQLRPAKLPNKEVIGLLQKIKESITPKVDEEGNPAVDAQGNAVTPDNSYGLIRQLHSDLGERIREYYQGNNALIGEKGVGYLERVQNALEDDMRNYAKNSGVPEIVDAGQAADEYYKTARVPYKNGMLAAAATSTEPDQIFQQFIKAGKGDRAQNFYDALDDRGRAAVRYNMIAKAIDDSINPQSSIFSPQKFFTAVDKLDDAYGVFFNAQDKAEIQGFKNLMGHVIRAGQYAENPPTGQRVIPILMAFAAGKYASAIAAHPMVAAGGAALLGLGRALFTTVKGRDLLLRLNGIKPGTPLMESVWQKIGRELPPEPPEGPGGGEPPPEEPPEGPPTGGGPPSTPPAGGGGAAGGPAASMGKGPDQALAYAKEQAAAGNDVKAEDLQRRFQLGYDAAQKIAAQAKK